MRTQPAEKQNLINRIQSVNFFLLCSNQDFFLLYKYIHNVQLQARCFTKAHIDFFWCAVLYTSFFWHYYCATLWLRQNQMNFDFNLICWALCAASPETDFFLFKHYHADSCYQESYGYSHESLVARSTFHKISLHTNTSTLFFQGGFFMLFFSKYEIKFDSHFFLSDSQSIYFNIAWGNGMLLQKT